MPSFAGVDGGIRVANLSCGWAPDMRWDRILRFRDVRAIPSVGLYGIIYQLPPPKSMAELAAYAATRDSGGTTCEWRCAYQHLRSAMVYRSRLVDAARNFLASARQRHAAGAVAQQRGELSSGSGPVGDVASGEAYELRAGGGGVESAGASVRVLAVHWRRGDFLSRGGAEMACADEASGEMLHAVTSWGGGGGAGAGGGASGESDDSGDSIELAQKACVHASVVLTPMELAEEVHARLAEHNASLVFLASNAKPEEVAALEAAMRGTPILRFESPKPPAEPSASASSSSNAGESNPASASEESAPPQPPAYSSAELAVIDTLICALADAFLGTRRSMFSWNILEERVLQGRRAETGRLLGLRRHGKPKALTKSAAKAIEAARAAAAAAGQKR